MRLLALASVLVVGSSAAEAQPAGAQAEVLFREGRELMQKQKYAEACTAFEQSQKLEPAPATLLNLAGCREKNGQLATAWGLFLEAERTTRSAADGSTKQLHDVAKTKAAKLESRVSKLTITVATPAEGVEVKRGSETVETAMLGRALPIDGGTYTISASAAGKKPWSTQITIAAEKDTKTVDVPVLDKQPPVTTTATKPVNPPPPKTTPPPKPAPPPKTAVTTTAPTRSRSKVPYLVGGGGVVLIAGAVVLGLHGKSIYNDAKAEMTDQMRRDDLESRANTNLLVAEGVGAAGVALVGVGVWLLLTRHDEEPSRTARVVSVTPNGFAIGGSF